MLTSVSLWICGLLGIPVVIPSEPRSWPIGRSLLLKTGFRDFFFLNLNHCVWYFSDKIKKKKKKFFVGEC